MIKIEDEIVPKMNILKKEATISHDGNQFLLRIPKAVSDLYEINKGDKFVFIIKIPTKEAEEILGKFEIKGVSK